MSKPELAFEFTYRLDVEGPLESRDGPGPSAQTQFWQMSKATLEGPRIKASTPMPGLDWFRPSADGYGRPHVRLPFQTDDGALLLLEYRGIAQASPAFVRAVEQGGTTDWDDQYMRMCLTFETTSERYAWLTQSLFIARGRLLGAKQIEYAVYRLL